MLDERALELFGELPLEDLTRTGSWLTCVEVQLGCNTLRVVFIQTQLSSSPNASTVRPIPVSRLNSVERQELVTILVGIRSGLAHLFRKKKVIGKIV